MKGFWAWVHEMPASPPTQKFSGPEENAMRET